MSSHVYHEISLHLNWHTKEDLPLLRDELEQAAWREIRAKAERIKGVWLKGIGGTDTHVHVAVQIEPFVTISDMVGELKGASAFEVNQRMSRKLLEWQRGYGVVSFGKRNLPWVLGYIAQQREHHAGGRVEERLERCDADEEEGSPDAG